MSLTKQQHAGSSQHRRRPGTIRTSTCAHAGSKKHHCAHFQGGFRDSQAGLSQGTDTVTGTNPDQGLTVFTTQTRDASWNGHVTGNGPFAASQAGVWTCAIKTWAASTRGARAVLSSRKLTSWFCHASASRSTHAHEKHARAQVALSRYRTSVCSVTWRQNETTWRLTQTRAINKEASRQFQIKDHFREIWGIKYKVSIKNSNYSKNVTKTHFCCCLLLEQSIQMSLLLKRKMNPMNQESSHRFSEARLESDFHWLCLFARCHICFFFFWGGVSFRAAVSSSSGPACLFALWLSWTFGIKCYYVYSIHLIIVKF